MKKIIILVLTLLAVSSSIEAGYYNNHNYRRGYRSRDYGNRGWRNNRYGWGNRNGWRSNLWTSYYQPYSVFSSWPYDEYDYSYDGYDYVDYCAHYPNICSFGFSSGY
jgi:hypothetical protein